LLDLYVEQNLCCNLGCELCLLYSIAASTHDAPYGRYVKTPRHPQNRKYITYRHAASIAVIVNQQLNLAVILQLNLFDKIGSCCVYGRVQRCSINTIMLITR